MNKNLKNYSLRNSQRISIPTPMGTLTANDTKDLGIAAAIAAALALIGCGAKTLLKIWTKDNEADNTARVEDVKAKNAKDINSSKTDDEIRKKKAQAQIDLETYAGKKNIDFNHRKRMNDAGLLNEEQSNKPAVHEDITSDSWEESFQATHAFPEVPDMLKPIFAGVPKGFKNAMLLHLLSMYAALVFSRVRSTYSDGRSVSPNMHVIVIGAAGSGKGKFETMYQSLFEDVISAERIKFQNTDDTKKIIQLIGPDITEAKLGELLSNGQGAHLYLFASEVSEMRSKLKKNGGLTYTHLRKSLENEMVSHMTKEKGCPGLSPIYLNSTLTGTPKEVQKFFANEIESGTSQRFCFTYIPRLTTGNPPRLTLPGDDVMDNIKKQIAELRSKYCYIDGTGSGDDTVCNVTNINLNYLREELDAWNRNQKAIAERETDPYLKEMRIEISNRRERIAFSCGIVLHMLWGEPKDRATRKKVIDACLYLADYITESYLFSISKIERGFYRSVPCTTESHTPRRQFTEEEVAEMAHLHSQLDARGQHIYGWDTIGNMYNTSCTTVKRKVLEYERKKAC